MFRWKYRWGVVTKEENNVQKLAMTNASQYDEKYE